MEVKEIRPDQARAGASSGGVAGGDGLSAEAASAMMAGGHPHRRKEHGNRSGTNGTGFCAAESGEERSEAVGLRGEKECRAGVLSAGLEPDLHERTRMFRQRHQTV